jgi:hypothetical protein
MIVCLIAFVTFVIVAVEVESLFGVLVVLWMFGVTYTFHHRVETVLVVGGVLNNALGAVGFV